jgi:hypothetical protein
MSVPARASGHGRVPRCRASAIAGFTALWAALWAGGCAKPTEDSNAPSEEEPALGAQARNPNLQDLVVDGTRCDTRGARSEPLDTNHDGRNDLVSLYVTNEAGSLRCKQADLNFDGRLDAWFHYDEAGELVREQYDQDYDGRIDLGSYYEAGGLTLDEIDLNRDGFVDAWRRYDKGRLTRIETDRDGDGRPDMFAYYLAGRIDRIGYDVTGDGKVDQWDHDAARRARAAEQLRIKDKEEAEGTKEAGYVEEPGKKPGEGQEAVADEAETKADAKGGKGKGKGKGKGEDKAKAEPTKKPEPSKAEPAKKPEPVKPEPVKPEPVKPTPVKPTPVTPG